MARVRIELDSVAVGQLLNSNTNLRNHLMNGGAKVQAEAAATADAAQKGAGGTIDGYAQAGFSVVWEQRSKRPRVVIKSNNTDPETLERVYWYTQKRDGVTHLRAALYKFFPKRGK